MGVQAEEAPFAISTPEAQIGLEENRFKNVPFTVTNVAGRQLSATAVAHALDGAPAEWFTIEGEAGRVFAPDSVQQVLVRVEPPLGAPEGTYAFRLDMSSPERPAEVLAEGPACAVKVPRSTAKLTLPRGYLAALVGAAAGGVLWLGMLLVIAIVGMTADSDCADLSECIGDVLGLFLLLAFLFVVGLILMLVGAAIGIWLALRIKHYLGAKLTAVVFAVLMIPWTVLVFAVLDGLEITGTAIVILLPLLLLVIPAVIARGVVMLIRTHHL